MDNPLEEYDTIIWLSIGNGILTEQGTIMDDSHQWLPPKISACNSNCATQRCNISFHWSRPSRAYLQFCASKHTKHLYRLAIFLNISSCLPFHDCPVFGASTHSTWPIDDNGSVWKRTFFDNAWTSTLRGEFSPYLTGLHWQCQQSYFFLSCQKSFPHSSCFLLIWHLVPYNVITG